MKEKILLFLISIIIILAAGALFQYGEKVINKDATWGYSIFHFTDKDNVADKDKKMTDILSVTIENLEGEETVYEISFFINNQESEKIKQEITTGENKNIEPPKEVVELISSLEKKSTIDYLVKIKWNDQKETLTKKITLTNEK